MATKEPKALTKTAARKLYAQLRAFKKEFVLSQGDEVTPLETKLDDTINELSKFINGE